LQATQVQAVAAYAARQRDAVEQIGAELGEDRPGPDSSELCERGIAFEVAAALGVSATSARLLIADADDLTGHHRCVLDAFRQGRVSLFTARQIATGTRVLPDHLAAELDPVVAEEAAQLLPGQVKGMVEARVIAADPDAAARRAAIARDDTNVVFRPQPDTVATVTATLPAEQALACYQALDQHARTLRASGDARTLSQLRCDTLVERLTGTSTPTGCAGVEIQLVMTDQTLLGASDAPAELADYGPIPADLARRLATGNSRTWLRRLLTDPIDATVTGIDTGRRRFDGPVRTLIEVRDRRCRNPVCDAAIIDADHRIDHALGGPTDAANGNGYCSRCHHLKDHPRITVTTLLRRAKVDAGGDDDTASGGGTGGDANTAHGIIWSGPSGSHYLSLAPPALGHGHATPNQIRHRSRLLRQVTRTPSTRPDRGG
jgi:hypothetical protein